MVPKIHSNSSLSIPENISNYFGKIPGLDQTIMDAIRGHRSQEVSNTYGKGFRIEKLNEIGR